MLTDRVALITGASSGIGAGTALALAEAGATVVCAARRTADLERVVATVKERGGSARALRLDVTDSAAVEETFRRLAGEVPHLDVLVNSAGVMQSARVADAKLSEWERMIATNLFGLMNVSRHALPLMRERGRGHIVNISSVSGRLANIGSPAYAASKSGVDTFTESLRKECVGYGVRVTLIMPGMVETELMTHVEDEATRARFAALMEQMTPLQPADVAAAVVYAVSQPDHVSISEIVIRPSKQVE